MLSSFKLLQTGGGAVVFLTLDNGTTFLVLDDGTTFLTL